MSQSERWPHGEVAVDLDAVRPLARLQRRSVLARAVRRTMFAGVLLVAAALVVPFIDGADGMPPTIGSADPSGQRDEIAVLRGSLAKAQAVQRQLQAELEEARSARRATAWYEDVELLTYRSPFQRR